MQKRSMAYWLVVLLLVLNSQLLFVSVFNPVTIRGAQEGFFAILAFYTAFFYVPRRWALKQFPFTDAVLLLLILCAWVSSALFAYLMYGQPIHYGLLEDRRILNGLIYFPVIDAIRARVISTDDVMKMVFYSALLCAIVSLFVEPIQSKQIGDALVEFTSDGNEQKGRITVGVHYLALSCFILAVWATYKKQSGWYAVIAFLLMVIFFVALSRLVFVATMIVLVLLHINSMRNRLIALCIMLLGISASFVFQQEIILLVADYFPRYAQLFGAEYLAQSARAGTMQTIFDELNSHLYMEHGALSLQWNNGFHRLYGANFFLADIGYIGVLFRYGIFAPIVVGIFLFIMLRLYKTMPSCAERRLVVAGMVYLTILSITQAPLEYRGSIAGLIFAIGEGCRYTYAYQAIKKRKLARIEKEEI